MGGAESTHNQPLPGRENSRPGTQTSTEEDRQINFYGTDADNLFFIRHDAAQELRQQEEVSYPVRGQPYKMHSCPIGGVETFKKYYEEDGVRQEITVTPETEVELVLDAGTSSLIHGLGIFEKKSGQKLNPAIQVRHFAEASGSLEGMINKLARLMPSEDTLLKDTVMTETKSGIMTLVKGNHGSSILKQAASFIAYASKKLPSLINIFQTMFRSSQSGIPEIDIPLKVVDLIAKAGSVMSTLKRWLGAVGISKDQAIDALLKLGSTLPNTFSSVIDNTISWGFETIVRGIRNMAVSIAGDGDLYKALHRGFNGYLGVVIQGHHFYVSHHRFDAFMMGVKTITKVHMEMTTSGREKYRVGTANVNNSDLGGAIPFNLDRPLGSAGKSIAAADNIRYNLHWDHLGVATALYISFNIGAAWNIGVPVQDWNNQWIGISETFSLYGNKDLWMDLCEYVEIKVRVKVDRNSFGANTSNKIMIALGGDNDAINPDILAQNCEVLYFNTVTARNPDNQERVCTLRYRPQWTYSASASPMTGARLRIHAPLKFYVSCGSYTADGTAFVTSVFNTDQGNHGYARMAVESINIVCQPSEVRRGPNSVTRWDGQIVSPELALGFSMADMLGFGTPQTNRMQDACHLAGLELKQSSYYSVVTAAIAYLLNQDPDVLVLDSGLQLQELLPFEGLFFHNHSIYNVPASELPGRVADVATAMKTIYESIMASQFTSDGKTFAAALSHVVHGTYRATDPLAALTTIDDQPLQLGFAENYASGQGGLQIRADDQIDSVSSVWRKAKGLFSSVTKRLKSRQSRPPMAMVHAQIEKEGLSGTDSTDGPEDDSEFTKAIRMVKLRPIPVNHRYGESGSPDETDGPLPKQMITQLVDGKETGEPIDFNMWLRSPEPVVPSTADDFPITAENLKTLEDADATVAFYSVDDNGAIIPDSYVAINQDLSEASDVAVPTGESSLKFKIEIDETDGPMMKPSEVFSRWREARATLLKRYFAGAPRQYGKFIRSAFEYDPILGSLTDVEFEQLLELAANGDDIEGIDLSNSTIAEGLLFALSGRTGHHGAFSAIAADGTLCIRNVVVTNANEDIADADQVHVVSTVNYKELDGVDGLADLEPTDDALNHADMKCGLGFTECMAILEYAGLQSRYSEDVNITGPMVRRAMLLTCLYCPEFRQLQSFYELFLDGSATCTGDVVPVRQDIEYRPRNMAIMAADNIVSMLEDAKENGGVMNFDLLCPTDLLLAYAFCSIAGQSRVSITSTDAGYFNSITTIVRELVSERYAPLSLRHVTKTVLEKNPTHEMWRSAHTSADMYGLYTYKTSPEQVLYLEHIKCLSNFMQPLLPSMCRAVNDETDGLSQSDEDELLFLATRTVVRTVNPNSRYLANLGFSEHDALVGGLQEVKLVCGEDETDGPLMTKADVFEKLYSGRVRGRLSMPAPVYRPPVRPDNIPPGHELSDLERRILEAAAQVRPELPDPLEPEMPEDGTLLMVSA